MDVFLVAAAGFLSGGFAIPLGFALDVDPLATYLGASIGALVGVVVFLYAGDRLMAWVGRRPPGDADVSERALRLRDKGPGWLGVVGPTFPGVTVSVVLALAAGFDRRRFVLWCTVGIFGLYAAYTLVLSVIVG